MLGKMAFRKSARGGFSADSWERISDSLSYFSTNLEKLGKNSEVKYGNENYFEEFSRNFQNPNFFPKFLVEQKVLPKSLELASICQSSMTLDRWLKVQKS